MFSLLVSTLIGVISPLIQGEQKGSKEKQACLRLSLHDLQFLLSKSKFVFFPELTKTEILCGL